MKKKIDKAVTEFAGGDHSPVVNESMQRWLVSRHYRREKEEALLEVWKSTADISSSTDAEALGRIYSKYIFSQTGLSGSRKGSRRRLHRYAVAAVLLLCLMIPGYFVVRLVTAGNEIMNSFTAEGPDNTFRFADGSEIVVAPGSVIFYSPDYEKTRTVSLVGEAYFRIARQKGRVFRINTLDSHIIVHGTEFNIKAHADDRRTETVLVNGSIEFFYSGGNILMEPNTKLVFDRTTDQVDMFRICPEHEFGDGRFSFERTRLSEIFGIVEGLYGRRIHIGPTAGSVEFTGSIDRNNPLEHTLDVLTLTTGTTYEIKEGSVVVR